MLLRRLNRAQRGVIVTSLGLAFYFLGQWITELGTHLPYRAVEYSSLQGPAVLGGFHPWVRFAIWVLLLAFWVGVSIPLLSNRITDEGHR
jgi:hypothetical protein